jgi:hypothetical protein
LGIINSREPPAPAGGVSITAYCGSIYKKPPYVDFFLDFLELHDKINKNVVDVGEEPLLGKSLVLNLGDAIAKLITLQTPGEVVSMVN